jgi:hypothetical protein
VSDISNFVILDIQSEFAIIVPVYAVCKFVINSTLAILSSVSYSGVQLLSSEYATNLCELNSNHQFVLNLLVP